ncbi:MAG TPA: cysteine desulfurase family protein [Rhodocyclaceae bacterium]|nr:cysteine desulfurase family protein [Rhodocyclaceae bacterium]
MTPPVYLDYNATTPVAPEVVEAAMRSMVATYGNPSSSYSLGREAHATVEDARAAVAELIGAAGADEVCFTGCATEANNLALLGVARKLQAAKRHLVVSAIEHPAVMEPALQLKREGWALTVVPVDGFGRVSAADVQAALRPDTALVSIMHANNEIGTVQPIREISDITRRDGILLHTDAAQSVGKIPVDVETLGVDLLTLAGHKFHATKGIGALYVRRGTPIVNVLFGAGQEHGLRPGTENVPAIAGLGAAARLARGRLPSVDARLRATRDALHERLQAAVPGLVLNGHPTDRLPNTLHVSFPGVSGRALLQAASEHVAASVGSACHSAGDAVSGVLAAIACDAARATGAVRLSTGWPTTMDDIERAASALVLAWRRLVEP